jgi:hypothetical protein
MELTIQLSFQRSVQSLGELALWESRLVPTPDPEDPNFVLTDTRGGLTGANSVVAADINQDGFQDFGRMQAVLIQW